MNVQTPVEMVQQGVCSKQDLLDARSACNVGPQAATCVQFYQFLAGNKPNCGKCLAPFDYAFQDLTGIYNCLSPYVSMNCRHITGCVDDCTTQSCKQCPNMGAQQQCDQTVKAPMGQCFSYVQQSSCIIQGLFGGGQFCNPGQYFGNFGAWLQGVGQHYCGP